MRVGVATANALTPGIFLTRQALPARGANPGGGTSSRLGTAQDVANKTGGSWDGWTLGGTMANRLDDNGGIGARHDCTGSRLVELGGC
jgi:hypothetical protein